jgi:SAM-dependent methyltransferase
VEVAKKNYFDGLVAKNYDLAPDIFDSAFVDATVSFLADLAQGGSVLELGIGTGRIALPLSQRGVSVHGIELSPAMVAQLQRKPGAVDIGVTIGDFAATGVEGTFRLAYLVYNTITNLTTQDEQVKCFRDVARHLEPGGKFVIELEVPPLQRLPPGEDVLAFSLNPPHLGFDEIDIVTQQGISHHYWVADGKSWVNSMPYRFVWPSELDLMARIAGMTLRERWGDWNREPFTATSTKHISVWEKSS